LRVAILLLSFCLFVFGSDIKPKKSYTLDSPAADMVFRGSTLYACTEKGDIYEIAKAAKKIYSLPHLAAQKRAQKASSLDIAPNTKTLIVAAEDGSLYVSKNKLLQKSSFHTNSVIKKVLLVSDSVALIALVSSEIALFDITNNKLIYSVQVSSSPFSDMALSADKKTAAIVGEAGVVYMLDVASGKIKAAHKNINLDNIYKIDYQNRMILTAGQDRKATLVSESGVVKVKFDADFLVYAAALSPAAAKAAIAIDEQNNIAVFDTLTKSRIATAKGHNATLNRIVFLNETEFASCADENKILIWGIK
jgi:WD40 repeat protein